MMINTFVLVSLLSYSFLMYFPLDKKEIGLNNDDLCYYNDGNNIYLKGCNEGYYCGNITIESGICLEFKSIIMKYKEKCNQNTICDKNLECDDKNLCVINGNTPYIQEDKASNKKHYYCPDQQIPKNQSVCESLTDPMKDKCYFETNNTKFTCFSYDYLKVCGKLDIDKKISLNSDLGIYEDGEFVGDALACKSGFTLFLNENNNNKLFPVCVTITHVEKDGNSCIIRYTKGDNNELFYDKNNPFYAQNEFPDCNLIMTKIELFKEYLNLFQKLKTHCQNGEFYNEPFTCENDELRKIWYYYNHPDHYLLYKNDEEIIDYLMQRNYPTHKSNATETDQEQRKDSSGFLNIR